MIKKKMKKWESLINVLYINCMFKQIKLSSPVDRYSLWKWEKFLAPSFRLHKPRQNKKAKKTPREKSIDTKILSLATFEIKQQ